MTLVLTNAARNAKVAAVNALVSGGVIKFLTAGDAVVASMGFGAVAFLPPSAGSATLPSPLIDPFTEAGTITKFTIESSTGVIVMSGSVTDIGGGGDLELDNRVLATGDRLEITNIIYTQPASE